MRHYAGDVTYRVTDWLKKGRGELRGDLARLLHVADWPFLSALPGLTSTDDTSAAAPAAAAPDAAPPSSAAITPRSAQGISALQDSLITQVASTRPANTGIYAASGGSWWREAVYRCAALPRTRQR